MLPLLQKQAAAQEQLGALPPPRELVAAQQELAARISGLESDLQLLQVDQKSSAEKAKSAGKEIAALQKVRRAAGAGCTWRWAANGCPLGARMPSHFIPPPPPPLPACLT